MRPRENPLSGHLLRALATLLEEASVTRAALSSQIVIVMLGSSVVSQISVEELTFVASYIQSRNFRAFETYIVSAAIYLALAILLRTFLGWVGGLIFRRKAAR